MDLTSENIKQATQVPELREEVTREEITLARIRSISVSRE